MYRPQHRISIGQKERMMGVLAAMGVKLWPWACLLTSITCATELPPAKMLQMGRIMQCVFCQILTEEVLNARYRDLTESEARQKLKKYCSDIAPQVAAVSGAKSPKESAT